MANVLVVAEIAEGKLKSTSLSAVTFARQIVSAAGGSFSILAIGGVGTDAAASTLQALGATKVLVATDASLNNYLAETYTPTVTSLASAFDVIVATASSFGKDLLPRVAARLDTGFASDCAGVSYDGKSLVFKRPMYAGNAFGYVTISTPKIVATCRQSEFEAAAPTGGSSPLETVAFVAPTSNAAKRVSFVSKDEVKAHARNSVTPRSSFRVAAASRSASSKCSSPWPTRWVQPLERVARPVTRATPPATSKLGKRAKSWLRACILPSASRVPFSTSRV